MDTEQTADSARLGNAQEPEVQLSAVPQVGNGFPPLTDRKQPTDLGDEQLAEVISNGLVKLAVDSERLKPYFFELRERFHRKPATAEIHGCRTWDEFCAKVLKRTRRAVNYLLAGGNPASKRKSKDGTGQQSTAVASSVEDAKPTFAIADSPLDADAVWSKQDASRQILAWSLSCLKKFPPAEQREISEDVTAKLRDEMMFEVPQPPPITGDPVPEPELGTLEELRHRISRMADIQEIEEALMAHFSRLAEPLLSGHPHHSMCQSVTVRITRPSKLRIEVGDWVEYGEKAKSDRLVEQVGSERAVGRIVGQDLLERPRVLWHNGERWLAKAYSLFDRQAVRVLFDWQAEAKYAEAFCSYPGRPTTSGDEADEPSAGGASAELPEVGTVAWERRNYLMSLRSRMNIAAKPVDFPDETVPSLKEHQETIRQRIAEIEGMSDEEFTVYLKSITLGDADDEEEDE